MSVAAKSLCPECFATLEAEYVDQDGQVRLVRECPDHGRFDPVVWRDADHWRWTQRFQPRGDPGAGLEVVNRHACLVVLDVTTRCNLECSYCFASSGPGGRDLPLDRIEELLDGVVADGGPRPLQLSGGEPTVHPDLPAVVQAARDRGFDHVEVNTNGLRIADSDDYAARLAQAGVTCIYLQFDGFDDEAGAAMRGRDFAKAKRRAIDRCHKAGLPVVLACTVVEGVNDDEVGDVLGFAWDHDGVRAVNFQPMARFGRYDRDPGRLSLDAVERLLADQVPWLEAGDFVPVPCCSPTCQMATLIVPGQDDPVPITRFIDDDVWASTGPDVDEAGWMEVLAGTDKGRDPEFLASCCGIEVPPRLASVLGDAMPVGLVGFMDAACADADVLDNCCIAVPTDDGLVPFCAYNMTDADGRYAFRDRMDWPGRREVA